MASNIRGIDFDCANPYELAGFWSEVTGWPRGADDKPEDDECAVVPPQGGLFQALLFLRVPEGKIVKNRMHLDIAPADITRAEEVQRLLALGATHVEDHVGPRGLGWTVLADPEGNEFCVESSDAERAAVRAAQAATAEATGTEATTAAESTS